LAKIDHLCGLSTTNTIWCTQEPLSTNILFPTDNQSNICPTEQIKATRKDSILASSNFAFN